MKCIQSVDGGIVLRLKDDEASKMVARGTFKYVPRKTWKEQVRDKKKNVTTSKAEKE